MYWTSIGYHAIWVPNWHFLINENTLIYSLLLTIISNRKPLELFRREKYNPPEIFTVFVYAFQGRV